MSRIVGLNAFEPDAIQLVSRKVKKDVCACVEKSLAPRKVNHNGSVEYIGCRPINQFHFTATNS